MSAPSSHSLASTSNSVLEAQHPNTLSPLTRAVTHSTWTAPPGRMVNPMDGHSGYTFSSSWTHESRHDGGRQSIVADAPPPYAEDAEIALPEYSLQTPEPVTLAMYLFQLGFLFPPFWIFGALIILSPLREPQSSSEDMLAWMPEKTEMECRQIIATMREVELKWAKRCLCALAVLILLAVTGGLAAWRILRN